MFSYLRSVLHMELQDNGLHTEKKGRDREGSSCLCTFLGTDPKSFLPFHSNTVIGYWAKHFHTLSH